MSTRFRRNKPSMNSISPLGNVIVLLSIVKKDICEVTVL